MADRGGDSAKMRSEIDIELETTRIVAAMGYMPSEFLGATRESLIQSVVIYKVLLDWVRAKGWRLDESQIRDIESAIAERLPHYVQSVSKPSNT